MTSPYALNSWHEPFSAICVAVATQVHAEMVTSKVGGTFANQASDR